MPPWAPALKLFLDVLAPLDPPWMLVGSAATRLHGVEGVEPGDVDVLVHPEAPDRLLADLGARLTAAVPGRPAGDDLATFVSSVERPLLRAGEWTFGRWFVDGAKLEVARIRGGGSQLVETLGAAVWDERREARWEGRVVPLVALEVQWATMAARGQAGRIAAVRDALRTVVPAGPSAWDDALARRALADRGLDPDAHRPGP